VKIPWKFSVFFRKNSAVSSGANSTVVFLPHFLPQRYNEHKGCTKILCVIFVSFVPLRLKKEEESRQKKKKNCGILRLQKI
jgi:hypothetical protein